MKIKYKKVNIFFVQKLLDYCAVPLDTERVKQTLALRGLVTETNS
jgi:hypothetical protein